MSPTLAISPLDESGQCTKALLHSYKAQLSGISVLYLDESFFVVLKKITAEHGKKPFVSGGTCDNYCKYYLKWEIILTIWPWIHITEITWTRLLRRCRYPLCNLSICTVVVRYLNLSAFAQLLSIKNYLQFLRYFPLKLDRSFQYFLFVS